MPSSQEVNCGVAIFHARQLATRRWTADALAHGRDWAGILEPGADRVGFTSAMKLPQKAHVEWSTSLCRREIQVELATFCLGNGQRGAFRRSLR